jgi:hypothetical protein
MCLLSLYIPDRVRVLKCTASVSRRCSGACHTLTCLILPRRELYLYSNELTSLVCVTWPDSLEGLSMNGNEGLTCFPMSQDFIDSIGRLGPSLEGGEMFFSNYDGPEACAQPLPQCEVSFRFVRIGRSSCEERVIACQWILMFQYQHARAHTG